MISDIFYPTFLKELKLMHKMMAAKKFSRFLKILEKAIFSSKPKQRAKLPL